MPPKGKQRAAASSSTNSNSDEQTPLLSNHVAPARNRKQDSSRIAYRILALAALVLTLLLVFESFRRLSHDKQRQSAHQPNSDDHGKGNNKLPLNYTLPGPKPGLRNPSYFARGRHGAVATEVNLCSNIGIDILRKGGNAIDSAIASTLCIGVVNMFSSGIGGGGFMVIRPPDVLNATPIAINFRESSPTGSKPDMFANKTSLLGGLAVGVPGELRGLEAAYRLYGGGVSWEELFEPNIKLAEEHVVGREVARRLSIPLLSDFMKDKPEWKKMFMRKGKFLVEGDKIYRPALAKTLRTIAKHGADAFYKGPIADSIVSTVQANGGLLTHADLTAYQATVEPATRGTFRNRTIWTSGAPSSGPVLISLLNSLEPIQDFVEEGKTGLNTHRFIEAQKFAFAHRTEFGDPVYMADPKKWHRIETKQFGANTLRKIQDNQTHTVEYYGAKFDIHEDRGTAHLNVVDSQGQAVSLTTTINFIFGSRVMDISTGVILNDEMDDFATPNQPDVFGLRPSPYNYPEGPRHPGEMGKKPLSSTSPIIVETEQGRFWLAMGGSGGSRIFGAVAQVLMNLDWGYDLSHAIEEPRVHHQLLPAYVSIESGIQPEIVESLRERGHNVTLFDINMAACEIQAVSYNSFEGWFTAASDSRKNGIPAAY